MNGKYYTFGKVNIKFHRQLIVAIILSILLIMKSCFFHKGNFTPNLFTVSTLTDRGASRGPVWLS